MGAKLLAVVEKNSQTQLLNLIKSTSSASSLFELLLQNQSYKNKVELALAVAEDFRLYFQQEPPMGLIQGIILWNRDLNQIKKGRGVSDRQLDDIVNKSINCSN